MGSPGEVGFPVPLTIVTILRLWVELPSVQPLSAFSIFVLCALSQPGCWLPQQTPPSRHLYRFELHTCSQAECAYNSDRDGGPFLQNCPLLA